MWYRAYQGKYVHYFINTGWKNHRDSLTACGKRAMVPRINDIIVEGPTCPECERKVSHADSPLFSEVSE